MCILVFTTFWKTQQDPVGQDWIQSSKTVLLHPSYEMWLKKPYQVMKYDLENYMFGLPNHNTKFLLLLYHLNMKKLNFFNNIETYLKFKSSWWSWQKRSTAWSNSSSKTCYIAESCYPQALWTMGNPNGQGMISFRWGKMKDDGFFFLLLQIWYFLSFKNPLLFFFLDLFLISFIFVKGIPGKLQISLK